MSNESEAVTAWLALAAGDKRQSASSDDYDDSIPEHYSWDSTVPSHARPGAGDYIVLWDRDRLLGASVIDRITTWNGEKDVYRCPKCNRALIKHRATESPRYKCFAEDCGFAFDQPTMLRQKVLNYRTDHGSQWVDLTGALTGAQLRSLCEQPRSQHSWRKLRWDTFCEALGQSGYGSPFMPVQTAPLPAGHTLRTVRVRRGQPAFRTRQLELFGNVCAFTGPCPAAVLEACHLYSYAEQGEHDEFGGLILRRDVHRLFDLGLISVNPESLTVDVDAELQTFPDYATLQGRTLQASLRDRHREWLRIHWNQHRG